MCAIAVQVWYASDLKGNYYSEGSIVVFPKNGHNLAVFLRDLRTGAFLLALWASGVSTNMYRCKDPHQLVTVFA